MFNKFTEICEEDGVKFDPPNQRVRCLGHIINLAAQNTLKNLKAEGPNDENEVLMDDNRNVASLGVVGKVSSLNFWYLFILINLSVIFNKPECHDSCGSLL
jgi:hypothetical protein